MKPEMRTAFLATDEHGFSRMIAQGGGLGGGQWSVVSGRFSVFGWAGCGWASTRARARFVAASSGFLVWFCELRVVLPSVCRLRGRGWWLERRRREKSDCAVKRHNRSGKMACF